MSCFIVSNETIRRVVNAASAFRSNNANDWNQRIGAATFGNILFGFPDGARCLDLGDEAELLFLAGELYNLNVDAFCERYPSEDSTLPGLAGRTRYPDISSDGDVPAFEAGQAAFHPGKEHTFDSRVAAYKAASCLRYQCSEGDVPEQPLYKALVQFIGDLACETIDETDEYDACPWG
jgi:hypothetical protein